MCALFAIDPHPITATFIMIISVPPPCTGISLLFKSLIAGQGMTRDLFFRTPFQGSTPIRIKCEFSRYFAPNFMFIYTYYTINKFSWQCSPLLYYVSENAVFFIQLSPPLPYLLGEIPVCRLNIFEKLCVDS